MDARFTNEQIRAYVLTTTPGALDVRIVDSGYRVEVLFPHPESPTGTRWKFHAIRRHVQERIETAGQTKAEDSRVATAPEITRRTGQHMDDVLGLTMDGLFPVVDIGGHLTGAVADRYDPGFVIVDWRDGRLVSDGTCCEAMIDREVWEESQPVTSTAKEAVTFWVRWASGKVAVHCAEAAAIADATTGDAESVDMVVVSGTHRSTTQVWPTRGATYTN